MYQRILRLFSILLMATGFMIAGFAGAHAADNGVVKTKSLYPMAETVQRLKDDVAAKGIMMFAEIDQAKLAANADIKINPSTLLIFGNPPLGIQFLTSNAASGIDWPVRLLVYEDDKGQVWTVYNDFGWIAKRHRIKNRAAAFKMASEVIASIVSSVATQQKAAN
jgi:uncharacterized protein (DUF302 family)